MQLSHRKSALLFATIIDQSLTIAEKWIEQTSGQSFAVVAELEDEIKIEVDLAPYIVVSVKQHECIVFHAFEFSSHGFSIPVFRKGDWISKLNAKFEEIKSSYNPEDEGH